jgi:cell division septation protein DedD
MARLTLALSLLLLVAAAPSARAQVADDVSRAYERASALVRDGQGEEGRRIVDSLFVRAREGSAEHAEALFWRAALARDAQQAERDYRVLVVQYPLSPRTDRALLALAQIELARGDRERALAHLVRIAREHPAGEARGTAAFWTARVRFDMNDEPRACAALDDAQRGLAADDVELRNQVEFYATRCVGVARDTSVSVASRPAAGGVSTAARDSDAPAGPRAAFAVQIAAYTARADADALVSRLARRDIAARVVGATSPYRVWTGSYPTRAEANAALRALREQRIEGFVVQQPDDR